MAKALMDERLLDVPFSKPFYKLILDEELDFEDFKIIQPDIGETVACIYKYSKKRKNIQQDESLTTEQKEKRISELKCMKGSIEEMELVFALPEGSLIENGENIDLTSQNVDEFIRLTKSLYMGEGIAAQITAFKKGFNEFFPISHLRIFANNEIDKALCGASQHSVSWEIKDIRDGLDIQTGLAPNSRAVNSLVNIMAGFTLEQRRSFLSWITGSPRLPVGGFKALTTKISVYRKLPEKGWSIDEDYPSVVSCFSKIHIPDYSTQEIMLERIIWAMGKGTGRYTRT